MAPTDNLAALRIEADDVIWLEDYEFFGAIGAYYADFSQVADEEVIKILKRFPLQTLADAKLTAAKRTPGVRSEPSPQSCRCSH